MSIENVQGSIDLLQLNMAHVREVPGKFEKKKCIVIPIEENGMYVKTDDTGTKAVSIRMNVNIYSNKDGANEFGNTHYAKFGYSKEFEQKYGEELTKELRGRYCGNFKPLVFAQGSVEAVAAPSIDEPDPDLPF